MTVPSRETYAAFYEGFYSKEGDRNPYNEGTTEHGIWEDGRLDAWEQSLPEAYNGCLCDCHLTSGIKHMARCCRPKSVK